LVAQGFFYVCFKNSFTNSIFVQDKKTMGGSEIILILLAVLVLFGADKLPEFAKGLGKGLREVKKATDEIKNELTNTSGDIVNEVKNSFDSVTKESTDLTSEVKEVQSTVERIIDTEIPDVYAETKKNNEQLPYHELVKRKKDEPKQ
jgi:sec-independent protein translocase protein TatA